VQTLTAELWRRAGRFEDALASCGLAETERSEVEEDDDPDTTGAVIEFIRNLSIAGDDEAHNCAEAFAEGE
jgi:hypothetical protein